MEVLYYRSIIVLSMDENFKKTVRLCRIAEISIH